MTSIQYQFNRISGANGSSSGSSSSGGSNSNSPNTASNKVAAPLSSLRGRTESPGLRSKYVSTTTGSPAAAASTRRPTPSRVSYERQTVTPDTYNPYAANLPNGLVKQSLLGIQQGSTRHSSFKIGEQDIDLAKKPKKFLTTHTALNNPTANATSLTKEVFLSEAFANSVNIGKSLNNEAAVSRLTPKTQYLNSKPDGLKAGMSGLPGSLLRAAQSHHVTNGVSSTEFYPAQQASYNPTSSQLASATSSAHHYLSTSGSDPDTLDLNAKGVVGLKNLGNTVSLNIKLCLK